MKPGNLSTSQKHYSSLDPQPYDYERNLAMKYSIGFFFFNSKSWDVVHSWLVEDGC